MHSRTRPLRSVNANCSAEEARRRPDVWGSWMVLEQDREELLFRSPAAVAGHLGYPGRSAPPPPGPVCYRSPNPLPQHRSCFTEAADCKVSFRFSCD